MVDIGDVYHGDSLKAEDLQGRDIKLIMADVVVKEFDNRGAIQKRLSIGFHGTDKRLVLNVINSKMIAEMYGTETDFWTGHPITIYPDKTTFQSNIVDCIRIRYIRPQGTAAGQGLPGAQHPNAPLPGVAAKVPDGFAPPAGQAYDTTPHPGDQAAQQPGSQYAMHKAAQMPLGDQGGPAQDRPIGGQGAGMGGEAPAGGGPGFVTDEDSEIPFGPCR